MGERVARPSHGLSKGIRGQELERNPKTNKALDRISFISLPSTNTHGRCLIDVLQNNTTEPTTPNTGLGTWRYLYLWEHIQETVKQVLKQCIEEGYPLGFAGSRIEGNNWSFHDVVHVIALSNPLNQRKSSFSKPSRSHQTGINEPHMA